MAMAITPGEGRVGLRACGEIGAERRDAAWIGMRLGRDWDEIGIQKARY